LFISELIVPLILLVMGSILTIFAHPIVKTMFIDFGIASTIEKYLLQRTKKHPKEVPGLFLNTWLIRGFGIFCLLFSVFLFYRAFSTSF
jgi:hypothetical protein